jgi:Sulfatase-modifying factor enzyme 1
MRKKLASSLQWLDMLKHERSVVHNTSKALERKSIVSIQSTNPPAHRTQRSRSWPGGTIVVGILFACSSFACTSVNSRSTPEPPTSDQIPESLAIQGEGIEFGFAIGRLRTPISSGSFQITKTPITVGHYRDCVTAAACSVPELSGGACATVAVPIIEGKTYDAKPSAESLPVTCASPRQAMAYCAWVGGSLPTAEQWHHAARGASVRRFAWGSETPGCDKHPRAISIEADGKGCCAGDSCEPATYYAVGQRSVAASPAGLLDVLLTPGELVRGTKGSSVPACDHENGACVVQGILPGAIDFMENISDDVSQVLQTKSGAAYSFRCAFEVNS